MISNLMHNKKMENNSNLNMAVLRGYIMYI